MAANRPFFRVSKKCDDCIVKYRVGDVNFITHCAEGDIENIRRDYERIKTAKYDIPESHAVTKREPAQKTVSLEDTFYYSLEPTDYFVIEDFTIKLFDENNEQYYMLDGKTENFIAGFFLTNQKIDLSENPYVKFFKYKKIAGYYILLILPRITFRDNRFAYFIPRYGKEITFAEAKRGWSAIEQYGFQKTIMNVGSISKTRKTKKSMLDKIEKSKQLEMKKRLRELRRIECIKPVKVDDESTPFFTGKKSFKKPIDWERVQREFDRLLKKFSRINIYT